MKKLTLATIALNTLIALTIGAAAPVNASTVDTGSVQGNGPKVEATSYPQAGETPYGTYQNKNKQQSPHKR